MAKLLAFLFLLVNLFKVSEGAPLVSTSTPMFVTEEWGGGAYSTTPFAFSTFRTPTEIDFNEKDVLVTDLVRYDNIFYGLARNVYDGDFDTTITTNNRQSTFTAYHYASSAMVGVKVMLEGVRPSSVNIEVQLSSTQDCYLVAETHDYLYTWIDFDCFDQIADTVVVVFESWRQEDVVIADIFMFGKDPSGRDPSQEGSPTPSPSSSPTPDWGNPSSRPFTSYTWPATVTPYDWDKAYEGTPAHDQGHTGTWAPEVQKEVPLNAWKQRYEAEEMMKQEGGGNSLMGLLAGSGYMDYTMAEYELEKEAKKKAEETKKKAEDSPESEDSSESKDSSEPEKADDKKVREKTTVGSTDVSNSIQKFQKLNGFPETGKVSKDVLDFVKQPRCGNSDLDPSIEAVEKEAKLCDTIIANSKPAPDIDLTCLKVKPGKQCGTLPRASRKAGFVEDDVPYTIDIDLQFKPKEGQSWDLLKDNFKIHFNYDATVKSKVQDEINVFASEEEFGFYYEKKKAGRRKNTGDYKMSEEQKSRRSFKIRIDVKKNKQAFLLINGNDIGQIKYKQPLKSEVRLEWAEGIPEIITARICKKPEPAPARAKRGASSHVWGTNQVSFSFQNYSSSLGETNTRQAVLEALGIISSTGKLEFVEKQRHIPTMLTLMFIKGTHADGKTFYGPGAEKGHAYSPVHSEIHFNDYEQFSLTKGNKKTSMFYVALHEVGHALGMTHSEYRDAVMAAEYKSEKAFETKALHREDEGVLKKQYPSMPLATGNVQTLSEQQRNDVPNIPYAPKLPLPRECFNQIDAAVNTGKAIYLISNSFIWQYDPATVKKMGGQMRVADVFSEWNFLTRAALSVDGTVYLIGNTAVYSYIPFGNGLLLNTRTTVNALFNSKKTKIDFPTIKSAFTLEQPDGKFITTLITGPKTYYKVTWKASKKKVASVEVVNDSGGTSLLGKVYGDGEFNAAAVYEREKNGVKWKEVMKFDRRYARSVKVYHGPGETVRARDPVLEVYRGFSIKNWCASST